MGVTSTETKRRAAKTKALRPAYDKMKVQFDALRSEVVFSLEKAIARRGVKIHQIDSRIKSLESLEIKARSKDTLDAIGDIKDIVGVRVICLIRSDIDIIDSIISSNFDVQDVDDKVNSDPSAFGYMSRHYICSLRKDHRGPRYDEIKSIEFEIQLRTVCMHAWAVLSHYLEYKGDWDVPADQRKALNALSGLFYVADGQFEQTYRNREASKSKRRKVDRARKAVQHTDLNLDTMRAYLRTKYPDRVQTRGGYSGIVKELKGIGYSTIEQVDRALLKSEDAFLEYEFRSPPARSPRYSDIGVARISLVSIPREKAKR